MKTTRILTCGVLIVGLTSLTHCAQKGSKVSPPPAAKKEEGNDNPYGKASPGSIESMPKDNSGDATGTGNPTTSNDNTAQQTPNTETTQVPGTTTMPPATTQTPGTTQTPATTTPPPATTTQPPNGNSATPTFLVGDWTNCVAGSNQYTGTTYKFGTNGGGVITKKYYTDSTCKTLVAGTQIGASDKTFTFTVGASLGNNTYKFDKVLALSSTITSYGAIMVNGNTLYFDTTNDTAVTSKTGPGGSDATRATTINTSKPYNK